MRALDPKIASANFQAAVLFSNDKEIDRFFARLLNPSWVNVGPLDKIFLKKKMLDEILRV